jgi:mannitol-specific phosphotransferase system IIBC component
VTLVSVVLPIGVDAQVIPILMADDGGRMSHAVKERRGALTGSCASQGRLTPTAQSCFCLGASIERDRTKN